MSDEKFMPLVSIVVPAYNHADYLDEAISSILEQSYPGIELIVINDGSTDNTSEILEKYPEIISINQENIGQANTLNKGWGLSKGEILAYLSADDFLLPDAVSKAVEYLLKHDNAVATYSDFNLVDSYSRIIRSVITQDFDYVNMLVKVSCPIGPGAFFRKDAYLISGNWDSALRQMPDYDFWLRMGLEGKIVRIPAILASFRVHEGSQTFSATDNARANEPIHIIQNLFDLKSDNPILAGQKKSALSSAYMVSSQLHIRAGRLVTGIKCFLYAFKQSPANGASLNSLRLLFNAFFNRAGHRILWMIRGNPYGK